MPSNDTFDYDSLDPEQHYGIRLLRILPKPEGDIHNTSPIRCLIHHVQISRCQSSADIPKGALVSGTPSVNFHAQVKNRPTEILETPHALGLMKDAKAGLVPKSRHGKLFLAKQEKSPRKKAKIPLEALLNMVAHPEDTGGGFTIVLDDQSSGSLSLHGNSRSHRALERLKKNFGIRSILHKLKRFLRDQAARKKQAPRPMPLLRQACGPKFSWGNYVALSYEWGDGPVDQQIFITNCFARGDRNRESPFYIRKNLHDALRRLRLMPQFIQGCRLWADFICINQHNTEERAAQMKIMSSIYERAGNILVWLGEGNDCLYKALDIVQEIGKGYRTEYQEAYDNVDPSLANLHREEVAVLLKIAMEQFLAYARNSGPRELFDSKEAQALDAFFPLRYWRRLWMIQELVMGTTDMAMVIGERVTEWRYVRDAAFVLAAIGDIIAHVVDEPFGGMRSDVPNTLVHIAKIAQLEIDTHRSYIPPNFGVSGLDNRTHLNSGSTPGPQRGDALWQVFKLMSYAKCYDPKDRVFGILALPCLPDMGIDHDLRKPMVKIYGEFTAACINNSGMHPLDYLCLIDGATDELIEDPREDNGGLTELRREKLPSWVPDLPSGRETGIIEGSFRAGFRWSHFQMEGWEEIGSQPRIRLSVDRTLYISGFVVDAVDGLGRIAPSKMRADSDRCHPRFQHDLVQPKKSAPWPLEDVSPQAAISACLTAGSDENGKQLRRADQNAALLESFVEVPGAVEPSLNFVAANAELRIGGVPMMDYLPNWHVAWDGYRTIGWETWALRNTIALRTNRKRLMISELGFLGLVPNSAVVGDVLIILQGHGRVIVASEMLGDDGLKRYRMKGEAYVVGMMLGEMMEDEFRKTMEDLAFV